MNAAAWAFWLGVLWLAYVWVGYPAVLTILSRIHRFHPAACDDYQPTVSVLIAARNEEKDIGWKIAETLAWDYPADRLELLVGSDASTDETDNIIRSVHDHRLRFIRSEERSGKCITLDRLSRMATGEILLFTDANTHIEAHTLKALVRNLADPRVGCITGLEQNASYDGASTITLGSDAYLGYESRICELESRVGSVLVCDGSIYCLRRSLYSNLDPDLANDLEHPIRAAAAGAKILYEPKARSFECCSTSAREDFARRRRIAGQGALAMWRLRQQLKGFRLWQFVSRKFLRWLTPIPLGTILVATLILRKESWFACLLLAQFVFYAAAFIGAWLGGKSRVRAVLRLPFVVLMANVAVFTGVFDACRGRTFATWNIAALSRGAGRAPS
jgi:cellulose synthase/poly-beta-1,6-N-acetylglucosamine synthase-like glycosyltransferase